GTGRISAQDVIAEIGVDMAILPTAAHLGSWAKWCPQVDQSGGKRKGSTAAGRGNPYLSAALGEITISAGRTQSFLGAKYRRLVFFQAEDGIRDWSVTGVQTCALPI